MRVCIWVLKLFRLDNTRGTEPLLAASQTHWSPYLHTVTLRYSNSQSHCSDVTHRFTTRVLYTVQSRGREKTAGSVPHRTHTNTQWIPFFPSPKVTLKSICASGKKHTKKTGTYWLWKAVLFKLWPCDLLTPHCPVLRGEGRRSPFEKYMTEEQREEVVRTAQKKG